MKKAVVLFNLGGPDSLKAVPKFLFNLFYDKHILTYSNPFRYFIAKAISTKRKNTSIEIYKKIGGKSPILENTLAQANLLEQQLNLEKNDEYSVFTCMRYWHPFADEVIHRVKKFDPRLVILLPLFPQYSTTTSLSAIENWQMIAKKFKLNCETKIINNFHKNDDFISAYSELTAKQYSLANKISKPRILFSAHGLPLHIVNKGDPYPLQVEESAKLIVEKLGISELDWKVSYQSKVGPLKWLEPSTDNELKRANIEQIPVVLTPISFVSEHSETLVELDIEYKELINEEQYFRVPTVGCHPKFIKCLVDLCCSK